MIPAGLAAVLEALRFRGARPDLLGRLSAAEWRRALPLCDGAQLTLPLAERCGGELPGWIQERVAEDFRKTAARTGRIAGEFRRVAGRLTGAGLDFVVLKGFAGAPEFVADPRRRVQYDLDLYLTPETVGRARDALLELGYEPLGGTQKLPTDHLPVMIRKTGWQWRGDYFDAEIPLSIDLHFRLWDPGTERLPAPGWEDFWARRVRKQWEGVCFGALHPVDAVGYAALHLLRHLLRGSLRLAHVYELGWFLHSQAGASAFWDDWRSLHGAGLRRLQAVGFRLAQEWFGCELAPPAQEEVTRLPEAVAAWFPRYGRSPLAGLVHPNKHELWLHLSLLDSWADRGSVLRRRLLPARLPGPVDAVYVPESELTLLQSGRRRLLYLAHLLRRAAHHVRVLPAVAAHGAAWLWSRRSPLGLGSAYWRFLGASAVFNLGMFVFFLLYNLYLLDFGYREDLLGLVSGAMTAGTIAGALPAGKLSQRWGLRAALVGCFGALAVCNAGRVLFPAREPLVAFSFLAGLAFALFAVNVAPAIARLADEPQRPRAFSLFFATGISLGIAGGLLGGWLPALLGSKKAAMLASCGLIALAALPAATLRLGAAPAAASRTYPAGPFLRRFLLVIAAWALVTGAFQPFFNAFFARRIGATVQQIGLAYSASQVAQVAALLLAPRLLRRMGLVRGVALTQVACGLALAALGFVAAFGPGVPAATAAYAAYMGFHYMGEPGLYSLLMNRVAPQQQSGASSLAHLIMFSVQAVTAVTAGAAVAAAGYSSVLAVAAAMALLAAWWLRRLPAEQTLE